MRPLTIIGPTGTGKSDLAIEIADRLSGKIAVEIVNTDAYQLYRGMDIGTGKVPLAQRRGIPHHQLDVLDVTETATVAGYQRSAAADIEAIASRGALPLLVGGSMLYVQSLLDDWAFPAKDPAIRARWERRLAQVGPARLHAELVRRTVRALEVVEITGRPYAASAPRIGSPRWDSAIIGLDCETKVLDERLAARTKAMFDRGLIEEVISLLPCGLARGVTASRALGYAQVMEALKAGADTQALDSARQQTCLATRRYVRRQRSWFRRDRRVRWLDATVSTAAHRTAIIEAVLGAWRRAS